MLVVASLSVLFESFLWCLGLVFGLLMAFLGHMNLILGISVHFCLNGIKKIEFRIENIQHERD